MVQGSEGDWVGHPITFAEWLYRYLIGEAMAGWDSKAFYPGPVCLEYPPAGPDQPTRQAYGPDRSMRHPHQLRRPLTQPCLSGAAGNPRPPQAAGDEWRAALHDPGACR
ncbi:hypothetical protein GCM10018783_00620 [Streptomyces griseosporeus]|nr:hypothetical protein GCM10018783_00620 [Streptomyces griseosporeus]